MSKAEEEFFALLEKKEPSREDGGKMADCVAVLFNRYGNYERQCGEYLKRASCGAGKRLMLLFYAAGLALSHDWVKKGFADWDERIMASESFAYKNEAAFRKGFYGMAGFSPKDVPRGRYGLAECLPAEDLARIDCRGLSFLLGFWQKWDQIHPTIKQSFFGGMATAGMDLSDPGVVPPLDYSGVSFPFR